MRGVHNCGPCVDPSTEGYQNKTGPGAGKWPMSGSSCLFIVVVVLCLFVCLFVAYPVTFEGPAFTRRYLNVNSGVGLTASDTLPIP